MEEIRIEIRYAGDKTTEGYILDISKSGMGLASCAQIEKGTEIEIVAQHPLLISLRAKVATIAQRNTQPYQYRLGVQFISCNESEKQKLIDFILKRERRRLGRLVL